MSFGDLGLATVWDHTQLGLDPSLSQPVPYPTSGTCTGDDLLAFAYDMARLRLGVRSKIRLR